MKKLTQRRWDAENKSAIHPKGVHPIFRNLLSSAALREIPFLVLGLRRREGGFYS